MKNIIKLFSLFFIISISSCQKCKDCSSKRTEYINGSTAVWCSNYVIQLGYHNWSAYIVNIYPSQGEVCGDNLIEIEAWYAEGDLDGDGTNDYRVYNDCSPTGNGPLWCLFC